MKRVLLHAGLLSSFFYSQDRQVTGILNIVVGLCKFNQVDSALQSAWFQPLNLSSEFLVSKFAFKFNLYRYIVGILFISVILPCFMAQVFVEEMNFDREVRGVSSQQLSS
jgi:hypothetical protein